MAEDILKITLPARWTSQFVARDGSSKAAERLGVAMEGSPIDGATFSGTLEALTSLGLMELKAQYEAALIQVQAENKDHSL